MFAGPFPPGVSEAEVRQLFACCGTIHRVLMMVTAAAVRPPSAATCWLTDEIGAVEKL